MLILAFVLIFLLACLFTFLLDAIKILERDNLKLWRHAIHMEFLLKKHDLWFDTSAEFDLEDDEQDQNDSFDQ